MTQLYSHELRAFPKVDLHRHLDCSMRWSTMLEIAKTLKLQLPSNPKDLRDYFLISEPMLDLGSVLRKFLTAQKLLASTEILERLAYEVCEDAYNDGVRVLELRYAPTFITEGHSQLTFDAIHMALLKGLARAEANFPIATGLICIIQRISDLKTAEKVTNFAIDHKSTFIALDLADNEEGFDPKPFAPFFQKAKKSGIHITIHSGEAPSPVAGEWVMNSIELLGAERIGHGVQIINHPKALAMVRDRKIPLEVCPISNWLTQAFKTYAEHPIRKLQEAGVLITLNPDDPGIFATQLSDDYEVLHRVHGFDRKDFDECNRIAFNASFIDSNKKKRVWS